MMQTARLMRLALIGLAALAGSAPAGRAIAQAQAPAQAQAQAQAPATRFALVIGNAAYTLAPTLPACTASANLLTGRLKAAGFQVTQVLDASNGVMGAALTNFAQSLRAVPAASSVLYMCGYGVNYRDRDFVLPVSATLPRPTDVLTQAVVARALVATALGAPAGPALVLLDLFALPAAPGAPQSAPPAGTIAKESANERLASAVALEPRSPDAATPAATALAQMMGEPQVRLAGAIGRMASLMPSGGTTLVGQQEATADLLLAGEPPPAPPPAVASTSAPSASAPSASAPSASAPSASASTAAAPVSPTGGTPAGAPSGAPSTASSTQASAAAPTEPAGSGATPPAAPAAEPPAAPPQAAPAAAQDTGSPPVPAQAGAEPSRPAAPPAAPPPPAPGQPNVAPAGSPGTQSTQPPPATEPSRPPGPQLAQTVKGTPQVVDTATLVINGQQIRLAGIEGEGGDYARQLRLLIEAKGRTLDCELTGSAYVCRLPNGMDIARTALFNGGARIAADASDDYRQQAEAARKAHRGIWHQPMPAPRPAPRPAPHGKPRLVRRPRSPGGAARRFRLPCRPRGAAGGTGSLPK